MGGFAAINGEPDGPPLLPRSRSPTSWPRSVGAFAVMAALRHRDRTGEGQIVDVNLLESMLQVHGPTAERLGRPRRAPAPTRIGDPLQRPAWHVPVRRRRVGRGVDVGGVGRAPPARRCSASATRSASRTFEGRTAHRDELDRLVGDWIAARPSVEVLAEFEAVEAAIAPVYTMADLLADEHVLEREAIVEVDGVHMQAPVARLSRTPGRVRHAGRPLGADTDAVLAHLADGRPVWRGADGDSGADEAEPHGRDASRGGSA